MLGRDGLRRGLWSMLFCAAVGLVFLGGAEAAVTWEKAYFGVSNPRAIEPTADGGYASFGLFHDRVKNKFSSGVLKLDALGNVEWYRKYDLANEGSLQGAALKTTKDGGFILCGASAWVMKLDSAGNVLWTNTYRLALPPGYNPNYSRYTEGIQILEADDGGYLFLATDTIQSFGSSSPLEKNLWLVKLDKDGEIQWQKNLGLRHDWAKELLKTRDGGYMLAAHTNLGTGGIAKTLLLKLDAGGTINWAKTYGGTYSNLVDALAELADGSLAMAGSSMPYQSQWEPWAVKLDASGNIVWQKAYGLPFVTYPVTVLPDAGDEFLLTGTGNYPFMLKLDATGMAQWTADLGGGIVRGFRPTADGGYVVARGTGYAAYVAKLDANGESCLTRNKNYLTTTLDNNFIAADANLKIVQTDAVPVSAAVVVEDLSLAEPYLFCISALPEIAVDAAALDYGFGTVEVLQSAAAKVFVSNTCGADLEVGAMTISGANAGDFTLTSDCSTVAAGGSCTAEVVFAPTSLGEKQALLTITSNDPKQPKIEIPLVGVSVDTTAPVVTLLGPAELSLEAGSAYVDAGATALDSFEGNLTAAIVTGNPVDISVVGTYLVTYDVTDTSGNQSRAVRTVRVVDTIAPEVSLSVDQTLLWPPNRKLVDVLVGGGAEDNGSGLLSVVLSVADEYGQYDQTLPAFGSTVALEAWRDGKDQDGRVYTLTVVATDRAGNATTRSTSVLVPHDMGK